MNNKKTGTQFEQEMASFLAGYGFWTHRFQDNHNGQPCDLIAARNGHTYLFDCKDCMGNSFLIRRMEENQYNAMKLFELTGNGSGKFAIRFKAEETYLVDYWQLKALLTNGVKQIDRAKCSLFGEELSAWIARKNQEDGWSGENADHCWQ